MANVLAENGIGLSVLAVFCRNPVKAFRRRLSESRRRQPIMFFKGFVERGMAGKPELKIHLFYRHILA